MNTNRLNNDMRDAFIDSVMEDVPNIDYEEKILDAVNKAAHASLPPAVKKLLASEDTSGFVNREHVTLNRHDNIPDGGYVSFILPAADDKSLKKLALGVTDELRKAWAKQNDSRKSLRAKIRAVAYHCTTRKQLAEAFPEFERYLPADESQAMQNLPALANVVSDFVKAGWPKDKKSVRKGAKSA